MSVDHEFTDEELREFAQHGVLMEQPAAPVVEEPAAPVVEEPAAPVVENQPRDPSTGQFVPAETAPAAADLAPPDPNAPAAPPPGFVPHQALHQERMQRQQMAQQMATLQARTNAILAAQQPAPVELPDLNEDPVGYVRGLEERLRSFEQTQAAEQQNRQIETAIETEEAHFRSYTPDYDQASTYYVQSRAQELLAFYPPQQAQQIMMAEARQMAQEAWQRGVPAPQMVYTMAQARGYRTGPSVAAQQPAMAPTAPQAPLSPVGGQFTAQNGAPSPSAVVQAAQAGQQAVRTLSGGSGAATAPTLNAEALLNMSDEQFEALLKLGTKGANARFAAIG